MALNNAEEFLGEAGIDLGRGVTVTPEVGIEGQVTNRQRLLQDVGQDVDIDTGASAGVRAKLSMQTPKNVDLFLDQSFGQDAWRRTKEGHIVFTDKTSGKEILLDESGFSLKDFADAADSAPQIVGALGAMVAVAAASGSAGASIPVLALAAAAGGFMTASVTDALNQANIDIGTVREIMDKRGLEAVIDFVFGVSTGGMSKLGATKVATDAATDSAPTARGVSAAINRVEQSTGTRVPASIGEITGNPTLQRIESIGEKLPLSSDVFRKQAIQRDLAVDTIQKDMVGSPRPTQVGQEFADEFGRKRSAEQAKLTGLRERIDANLQNNLDSIGDSFSPSGRGLTTSDAGSVYRASGELKRDAFLDGVKADYELARQLPGGKDTIVNPKGISSAVKRIEKEVPQERILEDIGGEVVQTGQKPAKAFIPPNVKRYLDSIKNLDTMTIDQARQGRRLIFDAISDAETLPGINTRFLKILGRKFTEAMDDAVTKLPDGRLKKQLIKANTNYKENFEQFLEPGIVELYRNPASAGFIEDSNLVSNSLNSLERVKRIKNFLGPESKEWGVFVRSAYNSMLDDSRNILKPNMLDINKLANRVSTMNPEIQKELFGKQAKNLENTLRQLSANSGDIPVSSIDDLKGGMAQAIRTASIREKAFNKEYNDRVLKPFLRNEIGATDMNPDDFVRHVMTGSEVSELDKVFKILGDNNPQRDKYERAVIMDLLEKGTTPAKAEDIVTGVIQEGDNIINGRSLFEAMKNGYGHNTGEKLVKVLGKEKVQLLRDLATIQASKEQKAKSAAGGLISGFIVSSLARGDLSSLPMIAQYKVLAWMLTNKKMGKILMSKSLPLSAKQSGKSKIAGVMTGPMINDLVDFVGPSDSTAILDFFGVPADSRPKKPNAENFLELDLNQQGLTEKPDIRLRAQ